MSPRDGRFQKAQSGNPNGRPRGSQSTWSKSYIDKILEAGDRIITVMVNGRPVQMSVHEAALHSEEAPALKGSPMAQRHLLDTYRLAYLEHCAHIEDECDRWEEHRRNLIALRAHAEATGQPIAHPFPHPDDIVIDRQKGVRLVGPLDEREQANLEDSIRFRDTLLVQDLYECCELRGRRQRRDLEEGPGVAILLAHFFNDRMPKRYRLTIPQMIVQLMYERMTKRELRKTLYQAWKSQGRPLRRGAMLGSIAKGRQLFAALSEAISLARAEV